MYIFPRIYETFNNNRMFFLRESLNIIINSSGAKNYKIDWKREREEGGDMQGVNLLHKLVKKSLKALK